MQQSGRQAADRGRLWCDPPLLRRRKALHPMWSSKCAPWQSRHQEVWWPLSGSRFAFGPAQLEACTTASSQDSTQHASAVNWRGGPFLVQQATSGPQGVSRNRSAPAVHVQDLRSQPGLVLTLVIPRVVCPSCSMPHVGRDAAAAQVLHSWTSRTGAVRAPSCEAS